MALTSKLGILKKGKIVDTTTGFIGDSAQGIGIGTGWNVLDKKFGGGRLTAAGVKIPFLPMVNGKEVCLNLTDALTYGSVVGLKNPLNKNNLIRGLISVGAKKFFELNDWIDPPNPVFTQAANAPFAMPNPSNGGVVH